MVIGLYIFAAGSAGTLGTPPRRGASHSVFTSPSAINAAKMTDASMNAAMVMNGTETRVARMKPKCGMLKKADLNRSRLPSNLLFSPDVSRRISQVLAVSTSDRSI